MTNLLIQNERLYRQGLGNKWGDEGVLQERIEVLRQGQSLPLHVKVGSSVRRGRGGTPLYDPNVGYWTRAKTVDMKMKIGLIQVDGKWPNLALMKISAWHKKQGDSVEWYQPMFGPYYRVYASKIFTDTADYPYMPESRIEGGSGYDLHSYLPEEMEKCFPDYSLYPFIDFAIGFTTRGCPRKCPFCIVPEKEGKIRVVGDIYSFWKGQERIRLLDNNLTAAPMEHFRGVMKQLRGTKAKVDISQGLDMRLLTEEHLEALKGVRMWKRLHFAWDRMKDESAIRKGLELATKYYHPDRITIYMLVGFDTTMEENMYRLGLLRAYRVNPFVMNYDRGDPVLCELARWVNMPRFFKTTSWADWCRIREPNYKKRENYRLCDPYTTPAEGIEATTEEEE